MWTPEYKKEWLEMVRTQEQILRGDALNGEQAFRLADIMRRRALEDYGQGVAMQIIMHGSTILSYKMDGSGNNNDWWMSRKLNTSTLTGMSSIRALMEVCEGNIEVDSEFTHGGDNGNFALCGGCFPYRSAQGKLLGFVLASGLKHQDDHMLIVNSLAELMGKEIPRF